MATKKLKPNPRRLSFGEVKKEFTERGWRLLSLSYQRNDQKLSVVCPKGHPIQWSLNELRSDRRQCPGCLNDINKIELFKIQAELRDWGYKCVSEKYVAANLRLEMRCDFGHRCKITWNGFRDGARCPTCWQD
jgi:hypothetical protein